MLCGFDVLLQRLPTTHQNMNTCGAQPDVETAETAPIVKHQVSMIWLIPIELMGCALLGGALFMNVDAALSHTAEE